MSDDINGFDVARVEYFNRRYERFERQRKGLPPMSMVGSKYQTKSSMQLVLVIGEYEGSDRNDDPPGIYYRHWPDGVATYFMSQSSVPHRLEGPICDRCNIVKSVPGSHRCGDCGEEV